MKLFFSLLAFLLFTGLLHAQVGIGIAVPHNSAQLEIVASDKGLLIPRIIKANRPISPATGLLIYQTDDVPGYYYFNGTVWQSFIMPAWSLAGNNGTTSANFIGTIDNVPLTFKVNNQVAGHISSSSTTTSLGYQALQINTGEDNTAIGYQALQKNSTGRYNVAIGYQSVMNTNASWYNTGVGWRALSNLSNGGYNTALGSETLLKNTSGNDNIAIGHASLSNNTIGIRNTAVGTNASFTTIDGSFNTSLGHSALRLNTTGSHNTALGNGALENNITGGGNIAIGSSSGRSSNNPTNSIAIGTLSNANSSFATAIGDGAIISTTANNAIAIGTQASVNSSLSAASSIAIGHAASVHVSSNTDVSNSIALGTGVIVNTKNTIQIGNNVVSVIKGNVNWSTLSDGRFKEAVKEDIPGLAFINQLRPVSYIVNKASLNKHYYKDYPVQAAAQSFEITSTKRETGFIAQEVEKAAKALGYSFSGVDVPATADALYSLRYSEFVVPLVKAVQEQQVLIETQNQKIEKLEKEMNNLIKVIEKIKAKL